MRTATRAHRTHLPATERVPALSADGAAERRDDPPAEGLVLADPHGLDLPDVLALLRTGRIEVEGRLVDASNATLFCSLTGDGVQAACVYKPVAGERPLWDFPDGTLAGREFSAYLVSEALGWEVVPPTVLRDGPFGTGMVQLWVDGDATVDLTRLVRADLAPLRRMAVFDAVINNADRKGGHLIPMPDGRVYGVDHGVSFAPEDKLRTVLWRWAGKSLPAGIVATLQEVRTDAGKSLPAGIVATLQEVRTDFDSTLAPLLAEHLTRREVRVTRMRLDRLLGSGCHPEPSGDWPAIPWPPF